MASSWFSSLAHFKVSIKTGTEKDKTEGEQDRKENN